MKVAVGLVTFNRAEMLKVALNALLAQTHPIDKIFVVDNASTDNTADVVAEFACRHPKVIEHVRNSSNEGSAGGFHEGAKHAFESGADWVWLTDDDAIPDPDTLRVLLSSSKAQDPTTGGLGCVVVGEDRRIFAANLQCLVDTSDFSLKAIDFNERTSEAVASDTNSFDGFLVHRRAIEAVGLPRKDYFLWWDDIEYSLRISRQFKLWVVPGATVVHRGELRSSEKKHPLFRAHVQTYDWNGCWRMYYRTRNFYALSRAYSAPVRFHLTFAKNFAKELLMPLLFNQDHVLDRMRLALSAAWDGYRGRLGKSVELKPPFRRR